MEAFRFVCYVVAVLLSVALVLHFWRIRLSVAKLLAVTWLGWAFNATTLVILLYLLMTRGTFPAWRDELATLNSLILAGVPVAIILWLLRNGNGADGPVPGG